MLFLGEHSLLQKSPFGDKLIQDFSPKELKLIIPKKTYEKNIEVQGNKEIIYEEYEHAHNFETVSPNTQKYVSQLTQLPSPRKSKKKY